RGRFTLVDDFPLARRGNTEENCGFVWNTTVRLLRALARRHHDFCADHPASSFVWSVRAGMACSRWLGREAVIPARSRITHWGKTPRASFYSTHAPYCRTRRGA